LTWADIVTPALPPPTRSVNTTADAIRFVLQHADTLTDWEREFTRSVTTQRYPLSAKQTAIVERLVQKVQRAEARAA
jgi:hypothetical protein